MNHTPVLHESLPVYSEGLKPSVSLKRLNPATGVPFRYGDTRAGGYRFQGYGAAIAKKTGFLYENWYSPETFEKAVAQQAVYRAANVKKIAARKAAYRAANVETIAAHQAKYRRANTAKIAAHHAKYAKDNPGKISAKTARRRAAKLQRTPPWLTKQDHEDIAKIYELCAERTRITGIPHAVDHILPLLGSTVSGLHIAANLQIITATENSAKNNRYVQA